MGAAFFLGHLAPASSFVAETTTALELIRTLEALKGMRVTFEAMNPWL